MESIRLGLVGLGEWPRGAYIPILKEMKTAQVVAVAARSEKTHALARDTFGTETALYKEWKKLIADENVEAIMIALPNALHAEVTEAAILSGKHVFFEPPTGLDREEVARVMAAMESSSAVVQPDFELRYLPVTKAVREFVMSGKAGRMLTVKISLFCNWGFDGGDWNQNIEEDGFFPWLSPWYLDVLDMICGAEPVEADVRGGRAMNGGVLDHGWANLRYKNGTLGQFEFNLVSGQEAEITLHLCGTNGEVVADLQRGGWRWRQHEGSWQEESTPCSEPVYGFAGMRESIAGFLSAISGGSTDAGIKVCRRVHQAVMLCHDKDAASRVEE